METIILGRYANDGTGDDLRTAFTKVNNNFASLEASEVVNGDNLGTGVGIFAQKGNMLLQFKSLTSTDGSVVITPSANTINLQAQLTSDNIETLVYGVDVRILSELLSLMVQSSQIPVDFGNFLNPVGANLNMGNMGGTPDDPVDYHYTGNELDFGVF